MQKQFQIAVLRVGESRWSLAAHGAAYTDDDSTRDYLASLKQRGAKVALLPLPVDKETGQ